MTMITDDSLSNSEKDTLMKNNIQITKNRKIWFYMMATIYIIVGVITFLQDHNFFWATLYVFSILVAGYLSRPRTEKEATKTYLNLVNQGKIKRFR